MILTKSCLSYIQALVDFYFQKVVAHGPCPCGELEKDENQKER